MGEIYGSPPKNTIISPINGKVIYLSVFLKLSNSKFGAFFNFKYSPISNENYE